MKIEISDDVVWRDLGGEIVILDLATQHYFGLTGAGNEMWQLIAEHGSSHKIIDDLVARYDDVDPGKLQGDFEKLVRELADKGMLRISDESA
jgi:coenzyme PQQ synthesis protein D (PqqD)